MTHTSYCWPLKQWLTSSPIIAFCSWTAPFCGVQRSWPCCFQGMQQDGDGLTFCISHHFTFCRIQPTLQCSESIPPFSRVSDSLLVTRSPSVFTSLVDSLLSMTFWTTIIRAFSRQHSVKRLARPWCMLLLAGKVPNSQQRATWKKWSRF